MKENWQNVDYWKKNYPELSSPFERLTLSNESIFLWNEVSAPLPSGSDYGVWGVFPEPKALVGFLKHVVFPIFFGIWLVREEWDKSSEDYKNLQEIIETAESSEKCRYTEDIPEMRAINDMLSSLFEKSNEEVRSGLKEVAEKLNNRWSKTPTWCFRIDVFDSPKAVCKEILDRQDFDLTDVNVFEEELSMTIDEWTTMCDTVMLDLEAQNRFYQVLEGN